MLDIEFKDFSAGYTLSGLQHALIKRLISPSRKYSRMLEKSQWWSKSDIESYQLDQLKKLLTKAYRDVPYYRGVMQVFNVTPSDICSLEDIQLIPFLEKKDVRRRYRDLVSTSSLTSLLYKCHTSGTTGTPLTLYRDIKNIGFEYAMLSRQRQWAGLYPDERIATLNGELIPEKKTQKNIFWSFSPFDNKLLMSSYHLSKETAMYYIDGLDRFQPQGIQGYPSSLYALAKFMNEHNISFPVKAALTSSETLSDEQRRVIGSAFNCIVYDYYGMAERVAAIHTCELGHYHIVPEYSLVEFIRNKNLSDGHYEIVGTSFTNHVMPFIRYRIGDIVQVSDTTCTCGREFPVIDRIVGRVDDYVVTPSGKLVGRLDHIFKGAQNLIQAQIYQPDSQHVILRIVPDQSYKKSDGEAVLEKLNRRLGDDMKYEIENVDSIPRTSRGKLKSVVSEVEVFAE